MRDESAHALHGLALSVIREAPIGDEMSGKRGRWERRLMAALAVVGLAATWVDHNRSDDVTGRSSLPLIGLTLSGDDIAHFERIYARLVGDNPDYQFYRDHNRWRRAQLRYDGTAYNVRVKSHGREPHGHWVERDGQRFISLSVRMAPGDRVAGLNRFKLIVRENLIDAQPLVMPMAREAHLLLQDHRLFRVQINDSREKLFYFSNLLDDEYTEAAGHASLRTVSYDYPDDGGTDKALVYSDSPQYRGTAYDFPEHFRRALMQMEVPRTDWEPMLRRYSAFNTALSGHGAADPADFFDLEYLGRYETIRYVLGLEGHGFIQGNLRVFLNTANGKFYPALGRDNSPSMLDLSGNRTPELQLNTYPEALDPRALPMFHFVASSERMRQVIYRAVYRFIVQDGARLVREIERGPVAGGSLTPTQFAIVRGAARASSVTAAATAWSGVMLRSGESREVLTSNMQSLRRYLERSAPEYSAQLSRGRVVLEIQPDSMSELGVKRLTVGVRAGAHRMDTPVTVHITEDPAAQGDPRSDPVVVDWLADGRLDVSRALADMRFATGLDRSIPQSVPEINVRWVPGLDADRRRVLEERFGLEPRNAVAPTTWSYALTDGSRANITSIVQHPDVEDTHGIDRAETLLVARYQAPSLERVPRLYTLALTFTGVPSGDLRLEDIDLVFVNTVTGQEVEARRVASHDVGDAPSRGPTDRAAARTGRRGVAGGAPAPGYPPDRSRRAVAEPRHVSPSRTPRSAAGVQPGHRVRHRPPARRRRRAARAGRAAHRWIRGPAGDDTVDRARTAVRGGGRRRRWHPSAPRSPIWSCRAAVTRGWTARSFRGRAVDSLSGPGVDVPHDDSRQSGR